MIESGEYNDLTVVRLHNGYLVKTDLVSDNHYRVCFLEEVKVLMNDVKNLEGKTLYVGFIDNDPVERDLERYRFKILKDRNISIKRKS